MDAPALIDLLQLQSIEGADLLKRVGGKLPVAMKALQLFRDGYPALPKKAEFLLVAHDLPQTAEVAHKLRGAAANISANRLARAALALESACRSGDLQTAWQCWDAVKAEMDAVMEELIRLPV